MMEVEFTPIHSDHRRSKGQHVQLDALGTVTQRRLRPRRPPKARLPTVAVSERSTGRASTARPGSFSGSGGSGRQLGLDESMKYCDLAPLNIGFPTYLSRMLMQEREGDKDKTLHSFSWPSRFLAFRHRRIKHCQTLVYIERPRPKS